MPTFDDHANFAASQVATAPSPATTGTSLTVTAGQGTRFPVAPFNATVWPAGATPTPQNAEIVRVTARATDTLTITRIQESTTARTITIGDSIAATITDKTLTDLEAVVPTLTAGSVVFAGATGGLSQDNANLFWDDTNNNLRLFGATVGTSGAGVLALGPGTAPTTSPVDTVQISTADYETEAGSRALYVRDERGGQYAMGTLATGAANLSVINPAGTVRVGLRAETTSSFVGTITNQPFYLMANNIGTMQIGTSGTVTLMGFASLGWSLASTGGHLWNLASDTSGGGRFFISDSNTGNTLLSCEATNVIYMFFATDLNAVRMLRLGAVDSGGAGYRMVRVPN